MIFNIIPRTVITEWRILLGEQNFCELLEKIYNEVLSGKVYEDFFKKDATNYISDIEKTMDILKAIISSMDIEEDKKKEIINIFQDQIKVLPDHVLKETSPYAKRIINKYFLASKKYSYKSIKKYKSNNKYMLILASGK